MKHTSFLAGASALLCSQAAFSATVIQIPSFDPTTFLSGGITAGIDFDDGTSSNYPDPTQSGFLSIPASNNKTYNVTTGGITFDIVVTNADQGNQNRNRNNVNAGRLINDFEQWYGRNQAGGVEASVNLSGLVANTNYQISFFTFNVGSGQTTHSFYEGTSSAAPLITSYTTSGNQNTYSTWSPGITFEINSGSGSEIDVTIQAPQFNAGPVTDPTQFIDSRLTLAGISVVQVATIPEPSSFAFVGLGALALLRRRRK